MKDNDLMGKSFEIACKSAGFLLPVVFGMSTFVNTALLYLGLHQFNFLRQVLSAVIMLLIIVVLGLCVMKLFLDNKENRFRILMVLLVPAIWIAAIITAFFNLGINSTTAYWGMWFLLYCIPAFFAAIIILLGDQLENLICNFKWYGLLMAPAIVFYIFRILFAREANPDYLSLGAINYMGIAYPMMMIVAFGFLDLFLYKRNKTHRMINWINITIATIAMIFSGTKGAIICAIVFTFFSLLYGFFYQQKRLTIRFAGLMLGLFFVFIVIIVPPASASYRILAQVQQLFAGVVQSAEMDQSQKDELLQMMEKPSHVPSENDNPTHNKPEASERYGEPINDRMMLYKLAVGEAINSPVFGMGPMGFIWKYGSYPHNAILEVASDFGMIVATVFVIVILGLISCVFLTAKSKAAPMGILMVLVSHIPKLMLSGTIYISEILVFSLTFSILFLLLNKNELIKQCRKKKLSK